MDFLKEFILINVLLLFIIGGLFTVTMFLSSKKDKREKGEIPIYSERCGGQFSLINFTTPFVRLTLYQDFMVISCWTKTIIEYHNIKQLKIIGILGTSIKIISKNNNKYEQSIIRTFNKKQVLYLINERIKIHHNKKV